MLRLSPSIFHSVSNKTLEAGYEARQLLPGGMLSVIIWSAAVTCYSQLFSRKTDTPGCKRDSGRIVLRSGKYRLLIFGLGMSVLVEYFDSLF